MPEHRAGEVHARDAAGVLTGGPGRRLQSVILDSRIHGTRQPANGCRDAPIAGRFGGTQEA
ncbi:hypothetical protein THICB3180034 [Thiomonas sp. CB3]|nr:hypothetical protein THICB3180034 [Thiomonas sp. CB3]